MGVTSIDFESILPKAIYRFSVIAGPPVSHKSTGKVILLNNDYS